MPPTTRRAVLGGAAATVAALAGCATNLTTGYAGSTAVEGSFPVVTEFARRVAGDVATVSDLVPLGQHGHGWQPAATVGRDVRRADVFVYVGEGFQPWADRLVQSLEEEGSSARTVAAREGVDLLPAVEPDEHGGEHGDEESHEESVHDDEHDGEPEPGADEHGHEGIDPHYWLDPTRAAQSVATVATGLGAVVPEQAAVFDANAAAYRDELAALDARFETRLAGRTRDSVLVAGHDAFGYLGRRYGFETHALSGISPDANPSPADVRTAQEIIQAEGIRHVLAPAFESDRAARQLVADTDAEAVLPVTSLGGLRREWVDDGWGYVDVMERVNLESLATALGAD